MTRKWFEQPFDENRREKKMRPHRQKFVIIVGAVFVDFICRFIRFLSKSFALRCWHKRLSTCLIALRCAIHCLQSKLLYQIGFYTCIDCIFLVMISSIIIFPRHCRQWIINVKHSLKIERKRKSDVFWDFKRYTQ